MKKVRLLSFSRGDKVKILVVPPQILKGGEEKRRFKVTLSPRTYIERTLFLLL